MSVPDPDVVLGQGALGTLFATVLAQGQRPVEVVSQRVEEPESVSLEVTGRGHRLAGQVRLVPRPPDQARLAIVATRSQQALERARQVEDSLTKDGLIVPLQNGLTSLSIADGLQTSRVAPAVVGFNARAIDERTVELTSPGDLTVGPIDPAAQATVGSLVAAFRRPVRATMTDNPRGAVWSKWCISCAINGLALVSGEGIGPMTRQRVGREALVSVLTECTQVAHAEDVELERVAGPLAPDTLAGNATSGLGGAFRRGIAWMIGRRYADVTPSSVRALREGRDPELEALNREAVDRGDEADVPTPWNRAVVAIGEEVLEGKRGASMQNLEDVGQRATAGPG